MFTIWGAPERFCDGVTRRGFLKIGAFGAGLTLADVLRLRALAGTSSKSANKAAIMIYLPGGPSHIDMYDLKPQAPKEFRGEFKPIATNVPGMRVCEHLPQISRDFDKFTVVRSVSHRDFNHPSAVYWMVTGHEYPRASGLKVVTAMPECAQ